MTALFTFLFSILQTPPGPAPLHPACYDPDEGIGHCDAACCLLSIIDLGCNGCISGEPWTTR